MEMNNKLNKVKFKLTNRYSYQVRIFRNFALKFELTINPIIDYQIHIRNKAIFRVK